MNDETFVDESEWVVTSNHVIPGPSSILRSPSVAGSVDSGYSIRSGSVYIPRPPIVRRRPPPPRPITVPRRTPPDRPPPPPPRTKKSKRSAPYPQVRKSRGARTGSSQGCPTLVIRRRCLVIMSCVSLTLSAISITIFGLLLLTSYTEPLEICVDCNGLNLSIAETDLLTTVNEGQCCARTQAQLSNLIELVLKQTQKKLKCVPLTSHLIHLSFKKGLSSTLVFDGNVNTSVGNPVKLVDNESRLEIINSGLYFIYSSIYFKFEEKCQMGENVETRCDQNVFKERDMSLLRSVHKCCSQGQFTSYSGGLFSLTARDKLYVQVTNSSLVDMDPTMTYFGLMLVRNLTTTTNNVGQTT